MTIRSAFIFTLLALVFVGIGCQPSADIMVQAPSPDEPAVENEEMSESEDEQTLPDEEGEEVGNGSEQINYTSYSGAYFDIEYPSNFTVDERVLEGSFEDRYMEVAFLSPNKDVEFYVFSPLWGGTAVYETVLDNEEVVAEQQTSSGEGHYKKTVDWITIEAKDGSYARSMRIITTNDETIRYLFGIKYTNQEALENYREEYNHFTNSLVQYADA